MSRSIQPKWVMCCDDGNSERTVDNEFAAFPDTERARVFRRLGPIRPTADDALRALSEGRKRRELPDLVLIDNWLGGHRRAGEASESGLELMRAIDQQFDGAPPPCVLMSGRMTPTLAYAFCNAGGIQAIDTVRDAPAWRDRIAIMWDALDGKRWAPTPNPPRVTFTADELALLPYLEGGRGNAEIRLKLDWNEDKLTRVRREIYRRLNLCGLIDVPYNSALTTVLSDAALAGGAVWEPLYALGADVA